MSRVHRLRTALVTGWLVLAGALGLALLDSSPADAAGWLVPTTLSVPGRTADQPQVAIDPAGNAVAVWQHFNGEKFVIEAASRPAGGNFSAPERLSANGQGAFEAQVAMDAAGDAVVAWEREKSDGNNQRIEAAWRRAGASSFSTPVKVSPAGSDSSEPQVAINAGGEALVTWQRRETGRFVVEAASAPTAGGAFSAPGQLSQGLESALEPQVALNNAGTAVVVWVRGKTGATVVEAALRLPGGKFFTTQVSPGTKGATMPQVALDPAGDAVIVWTGNDGGTSRVEAASRPAEALTFQTPVELAPSAVKPQVAIDAKGNAVAVWRSLAFVVEAASRPAGGAFSAPVRLSDPAETFAEDPQVSLDAAGNAMAIWRGGGRQTPRAAARAAGSSLWGEIPAAPAAEGHAPEAPALAIDPSGDAVAVWRLGVGENTVVEAAAYDVSAPQLRSLSIPATGVAGEPLSFSVNPFDVSSSQVKTLWSFGDRATANSAGATHTYAAPGTYKLTLTATDAAGNAASANGTVTIKPGRPKASAKRVARLRGRRALLSLSCPISGPCRGSAKLTAKRGSKKLTLGGRSFQIGAGGKLTLAIRLNAAAQRLLEAPRRKGLVVRLEGAGVESTTVRLRGSGR